MKNLFFIAALLLLPLGAAHAASDYYIKLGGVDGETTSAAPATFEVQTTVVATSTPARTTSAGTVTPPPEEEAKKGNVEYTWKVEEGEKAEEKESGEKGGTEDINIGVGELNSTGIEPDEIDFMGDSENATNFGVLLGGGGGGGGEGDEEKARGLERALQVLEENAKASDQAIESVSLNFEKITTRVRHEVQLFGFIPIDVEAEVEIDAEQRVAVRFPWWSFLATGDDEVALGERVYNTISNVLKTKHDTVKNSINNVR